MLDLNQTYVGDCLEVMQSIDNDSIDMILCDLPYGTTECEWDTIIDLRRLWVQYARVAKLNAAIVLTASQPFASQLVLSFPTWFRYSLVWDKVNKYTGALNANKMPLRRHEDILVFYGSLPTFNKQYRQGKAYVSTMNNGHGWHTNYGKGDELRYTVNDGNHNPCSIIEIPGDVKAELGLHPTQKPVALFEYLIKTYTNPGDLVLDNCAGSGTTGVACLNTGRNFILIEKDEQMAQKCANRIWEHYQKCQTLPSA